MHPQRKTVGNWRWWAWLTLILLLSSCAPWVRGGQPQLSEFTTLKAGETLGQTFVARYRGLNGVEIFIQPQGLGEDNLYFEVFQPDREGEKVDGSLLPLSSITSPGYQRFQFSPQDASNNQDYFFSLEMRGEGDVSVGIAPGEAYLDGSMYLQGAAQDSQVAFRLVYDPLQAGIGLLQLGVSWLGILLAAGLLFILPGWALLGLLWSAWKSHHWTEKLALATGVSLALYPLLFLWTNLAGLNLGRLYAIFPPLSGFLIILWQWRRIRFNFSPSPNLKAGLLQPSSSITLVIVMALVFAVRFWVIRSLDVPLWGDSYQHTVIAQLLVDNRGLFSSWQPYADLTTFTYHFGFHSLVAVFHYVTNLPLPLATLWTGQILNGLAVFSLVPLANRLGGNRWAGVIAVLVAGLLSPMPMFYLNWGRYTQLAGLAILPVAVYLFWEMCASRRFSWSLVIPVWITMAGLALTHYRVLIFAIFFVLAYWLLAARPGRLRALFLNTLGATLGATILFLPWFLRTFSGKISAIIGAQLSEPAQALSEWTQLYNAIGDLSLYLPTWIWISLPFLLVWSLWRRHRDIRLIVAWWALILLAANPAWLRLPGTGVLTNFAVFIAAYIPASLVFGAVIGREVSSYRAKDFLSTRITQASYLLILILLFAGVFWSARLRVADLQASTYSLATRSDLRAVRWIHEKIPQNANILVNAFFAYGGSSIVGSDGGWWLPILAQRRTTLPPLNYSAEIGVIPDYHQWTNALVAEIIEKGLDDPQVLDLLARRGITHVYIGQQQGRVNNIHPLLDPAELLDNPHFNLVYHEDRVWIYEFSNDRLGIDD
jgi:hypothetical protein